MTYLDFLSNAIFQSILSILKLNSIISSDITDRVISCGNYLESGTIRLTIFKGFIPFPRFLYIDTPSGSKIIDNYQNPSDLSNILDYHPNKGFFIDIKKIGASKIQKISVQYEKNVNKEILNLIKIERNDDVLKCINNSDYKFVNFMIKIKIPLPINVKDFLNFDNKKLKQYIENHLKIVDDQNNPISFSKNFYTYFKGATIELEINCLTDIEPHSIRIFKIYVKEKL